jgi:two-component system LytT family sensor kinase
MKRRYWSHSAFWLMYWFIYAYTYSRYDNDFAKLAWTEGVQMPARMLATYASFWMLDRYNGPRTTWLALAGIAVANIGGGFINRVLMMAYIQPGFFPESTFTFWDFRLMVDIFDCVLASGVALTARLFFRQQEAVRREEALRKEKLAAELQALKGQIHPHFLFNTLNNLYALARIRSEKTAPMALQLAHLLRFVLYETRKEAIPLEQECRILNDYIELEKLRFDDDRLRVETCFDLDDPRQPITPLLLLPLVENAFKHGVSEQSSDAWVQVQVQLRDGTLLVRVENSRPAEQPPNGGGIGMGNLRRQLELVYPGRHRLEVEDEDERFAVGLEIRLEERKESKRKLERAFSA